MNNYSDYIENIFNIYKLSDKDRFVVLSINIGKMDCLIKLKIIDKEGNTNNYKDIKFKRDRDIYNDFLVPLIKRLNDNKDFIINDIVNLDNDDLYTFRLISSNNDLITIDGLDKKSASSLKELFNKDRVNDNILI